MKLLFKKTLSALLAVLCFGGMLAAAADAPAVEEPLQPNDAAVADTVNGFLPFSEDITELEEQNLARTAEKKYTVTIPAGGTATLPQWNCTLKKGTVVEVQALSTTPSYEEFNFSLQSSKGGGFSYGITEGQTRRMTMPNDGDYTITFSCKKAISAWIKIVTDPS